MYKLYQVIHFNYSENDIGNYENYHIDVKLSKFQSICGKINRIFLENRYVEMN